MYGVRPFNVVTYLYKGELGQPLLMTIHNSELIVNCHYCVIELRERRTNKTAVDNFCFLARPFTQYSVLFLV